jgi:hypothetical protein
MPGYDYGCQVVCTGNVDNSELNAKTSKTCGRYTGAAKGRCVAGFHTGMRACVRRNAQHVVVAYNTKAPGVLQTEDVATADLVPNNRIAPLFQCPPANYLNVRSTLKREAAENILLRGYHFGTQKLGLISKTCNYTERTFGNDHIVVKFEDPAWPKPPHCRPSKCGSHECLQNREKESAAQIASRKGSDEVLFVSLKYGFVFHKTMKAAGSSILAFLKCNFEVQEITTIPRNAFHLISSFLYVLPTREPMGRFVSSFRQILSMMYDSKKEDIDHDTLDSYFYNMSTGPAQAHQQDESIAKQQMNHVMREDGMNEVEAATQLHVEPAAFEEWLYVPSASNSDIWKHASAFLLHIQTERGYHPQTEEKFRAFANDSMCNHNYYQCHHAETQSHNLQALLKSAWDANEVLRWPKPEVFVFHANTLKEDMAFFKKVVGYDKRHDKCPLEHQNSRPSPATNELKKTIVDADNGGVLQNEMCYRFLFDFVCFGYELPTGCAWLKK